MGQRILLIEDNDDIRALTHLVLERDGYSVLTAADGETGLRLLGQETVDLLLLDIMLPGMDGWEVCRRLRADPRSASLPVLLFTVRSEMIDQDSAEYGLTDGMVAKPFYRDELLDAVRHGLAGHLHNAVG
ncbi:MAG: response regulator [Armatimonadota bacterium]